MPSHDLQHIVGIEEVVQETFVRAFQFIQEFEWRGSGSLSAWLRGIARNIVVDAIRKKRPSHGLQVVERTAAEEVSPSKTARREIQPIKACVRGAPTRLSSSLDALSHRGPPNP